MKKSLPAELYGNIYAALREAASDLPDPRSGDAWTAGFRLARAVQQELAYANVDLATINPEEIVEEFFDKWDVDIDLDYDAIGDDFIEAWHKVKHPIGPLESAYKHAISGKNRAVVPHGLFMSRYRNERARIIMGMAAYLQEDQYPNYFFLPIESVAELLQISNQETSKIINKLQDAGILVCKEKAIAHKRARQFEYKPGGSLNRDRLTRSL